MLVLPAQDNLGIQWIDQDEELNPCIYETPVSSPTALTTVPNCCNLPLITLDYGT